MKTVYALVREEDTILGVYETFEMAWAARAVYRAKDELSLQFTVVEHRVRVER